MAVGVHIAEVASLAISEDAGGSATLAAVGMARSARMVVASVTVDSDARSASLAGRLCWMQQS